MRVEGCGLRVELRVWGSGFMAHGSGIGALACRVWGLGFRVHGSGFRVKG